MIFLTDDWAKRNAALAVPGAYWDGKVQGWVLGNAEDITPRAAAVALQLFPQLAADNPELVELRDTLIQDVEPIEYARQYADAWVQAGNDLAAFGPRVRRAMLDRGYEWHPYQITDGLYLCALLAQNGGAYLGWDRGLGKTLETAGIIDTLDCKHTLIVAPNTAKTSVWVDELQWALPWLPIIVLPNEKTKRERTLAQVKDTYRKGDPFVLVIHYEALGLIAGTQKNPNNKRSTRVLDGWRSLGIEFDLKVLDEGHRVSNRKTVQARASSKVPAKRRLLLSGSTFQNRWEELPAQLKFILPKIYSNMERDFNLRFLDRVESGYSKITIGVLPERVEDLRDELGRLGVWRRKVNRAIPNEVKVNLSTSQRKAYDELAEALLTQLEDGTTVKTQTGVAVLTRLRQVASGLDTLSRRVQDSTKLDAAIDVIKAKRRDGHDFVVFVWYKQSAYALQDRLANELPDVPCRVITGDVKQNDRAPIIRASQADVANGSGSILIGSIATMGESVNLQHLNHVIMLDHSWNPALNQQAVDRVDRQGQKRECYVTRIIAADTVDELVVMPKLLNKEALRDMVFGRQP